MAKYDVAVIGAGPGGYVAAIRAAQLGLKTVCIEKGKALGGTCLNVGCIPSKALLQSSEAYAFLEHSGVEHGLDCKGMKFNFKQMMTRKEGVVSTLVQGIAGLFQRNKVERVEGTATFTGPNTIEVTHGKKKETIEAANFILATGSEAIELPFLPFDEKVIVSSTGALSLPKVPKKMVVIGAGVIGVELASVYCRLGTKVDIIEMLDCVCPGMDGAVSRGLQQVLKKQGMTFHLSTTVEKADITAKGATLTAKQGDKKLTFKADVVLVAVGRRPYSEGLGLETIGIEPDRKGFVPVDGSFRTKHPHIYAIGDLVEGPMLAHRASEEGIAAAEVIAGKKTHIDYIGIPSVVYTHPEVASVGFTEEELKERGIKVKVGKCAFKGNARARCSGDTDGFVKIIGDAGSGKVLGLHIVGSHASEMIGEGVVAMEKRATLEEIARASHAHPTLSEAIKEAAMNALGVAIHL